jgi:hypothetical protein
MNYTSLIFPDVRRASSAARDAWGQRLFVHVAGVAKRDRNDVRKWTTLVRVCVWDNLSEAPGPESTRIVWFRVIHDIFPMNERLQRIRMVQTDTCRNCNMKDTLEHRITACGEGRAIWEHSKRLMAWMLRTIPSRIPDDWLLHPQFQIWPPKRRRAILWTLAQVILFRTQQTRTLTLRDFMELLQRSRWKLTRSKKGRESVGNYLSVLDWGSKIWLQTWWQKTSRKIMSQRRKQHDRPRIRMGVHDDGGVA